MNLTPLTALSPLDGRYHNKVSGLADYFSEFGLMRYRVKVEVEWLKALCAAPELTEIPTLSAQTIEELDGICKRFSVADAEAVKAIEQRTNHDVKAIEYWLREQISANREPAHFTQFIHFACTSEDINNICHAFMLCDSRATVMLPAIDAIIAKLTGIAHDTAEMPMLSRTHGQAATPTTVGKEIANFIHRLRRQRQRIAQIALPAKINGAVGNYNAHLAAYPNFDWESFARSFVTRLGFDFTPYTAQIEPHDGIAELLDAYAGLNTVLIDLDRDIWGYISLGYFRQRVTAGEVGSSTMPHKVNPIDFENAEGNLGMATALLAHFAEKLPVSRWQRDLTDSTVQRNFGVAIAYTLIAIESVQKGLAKLEVDQEAIATDAAASWEVLAEAIQTVMRRYGIPEPYEKLKSLTRGQTVNQATLAAFIQTLDIPASARERLLALRPDTYTGLAEDLARRP